MGNKGQALIVVLKFLAVVQLLKEGHTLLTDMEPFLLPIVLVYLWLNVVLWRPRPEGFYLTITFVAFQFFNYLYWFVTSTFLLPIIAYSQESKLLWGVLTVFYALMLGWTYQARAELGYCKTTPRTRGVGAVLVTLIVLTFSGYLTMDNLGVSGHEIIRFPGQNIMHGALTPDARYLFISQMDSKYYTTNILWDTKQRTSVKVSFKIDYSDLIFSPNGKYVAHIGSEVQVANIEEGTIIKKVERDRKFNRGMGKGAFSLDSNNIAYGTVEGIRILSLHSDDIIDLNLPNPPEYLSPTSQGGKLYPTNYSVSYSPDGLIIASAKEKGIVLWDLNTKQPLAVIKSKLRYIVHSKLKFSKDGKYLTVTGLTEYKTDGVEIIDIAQRKSLDYFPVGHQINAVDFSPDGRFVAVGTNSRNIDIVDVKNLKSFKLRSHPFTAVYLLAFSPDGKTLYTGGGNDLKIWNLTGQLN